MSHGQFILNMIICSAQSKPTWIHHVLSWPCFRNWYSRISMSLMIRVQLQGRLRNLTMILMTNLPMSKWIVCSYHTNNLNHFTNIKCHISHSSYHLCMCRFSINDRQSACYLHIRRHQSIRVQLNGSYKQKDRHVGSFTWWLSWYLLTCTVLLWANAYNATNRSRHLSLFKHYTNSTTNICCAWRESSHEDQTWLLSLHAINVNQETFQLCPAQHIQVLLYPYLWATNEVLMSLWQRINQRIPTMWYNLCPKNVNVMWMTTTMIPEFYPDVGMYPA